jgi:aldehyde dehydrogenase (NAD+)
VPRRDDGATQASSDHDRQRDVVSAPAIDVPIVPQALLEDLGTLLIDGAQTQAASGATRECVNPANGAVVTHFAEGGSEDIDRAVAAARRAFEGPYRRLRPVERRGILLRLADLVSEHAEQIAILDTLDMGAPISHTRKMVLGGVDRLRWYAGQAQALRGETIPNSLPQDVVSYTLREPVGVVGGITSWNGPINGAIWKIGPALTTGCTVVLKPAEESPLSALLLGRLCMEAGVPEGVVNVVTGGAEAGAALAAHADVDKVAFTGSVETGQKIVRASAGNLKRLSLELGGKSPQIICADADLDRATPVAAMSVFGNAGQICCAGTRLFVERAVFDEVVERVAAVGTALVQGDGMDPATQLGPLASAQQYERVNGYLEVGSQAGARAVIGGAPLAREGYFVPPTIFTGVTDEMRIAREEIFGPVVAALPFDDLDDAVRRANDTRFGLAAGVWTNDLGRAHRIAGRLAAGTVWVNGWGLFDPAVPFGGYKMSGYGRENGTQQLNEYLSTKSVWLTVD